MIEVKETDYWATPTEYTKGIVSYLKWANLINWSDGYDLDACANEHNAKCERFITEEQNALQVSWVGQRVWCNPPYSRTLLRLFIDKAIAEVNASKQQGEQKDVIMLLNVDPSTSYFNKILENAKAIVYVVGGRISFIDAKTGKRGNNPSKASMFVLFSTTKSDYVTSHYVDCKQLENAGLCS